MRIKLSTKISTQYFFKVEEWFSHFLVHVRKKNQIRNTKKKGVPGHPRDMQIFGALNDAGF